MNSGRFWSSVVSVDDSIDGSGRLDGRRGVLLHGDVTCTGVSFASGVGACCMLFGIDVGPATATTGGDGCAGNDADEVGRE